MTDLQIDPAKVDLAIAHARADLAVLHAEHDEHASHADEAWRRILHAENRLERLRELKAASELPAERYGR